MRSFSPGAVICISLWKSAPMNNGHNTLTHTLVVAVPQQVTLQPSTEPQIAAAAAITAVPAITADIVPGYRSHKHKDILGR